MERYAPKARSDAYGSRINRQHSPIVALAIPWLSIIFGSVLPVFVIATALPLVPPLGYLMLLAWRLVRPGLLPVWAGIPLGLFDDLFSGQPIGCGILLWSLTMLAIEILDTRIPWRTFVQDWFTAGLAVLGYVGAQLLLSGGSPSLAALVALGPQVLLSILLFPAAARLVSGLDNVRLRRWRVLA
ncbi:MAG: rod shape-determining protein MreD [Sphingomonadaceae bacterium]